MKVEGQPLKCEDPFKKHPITPYSEVVGDFEVSKTMSAHASEIVEVSLPGDQVGTESSTSPEAVEKAVPEDSPSGFSPTDSTGQRKSPERVIHTVRQNWHHYDFGLDSLGELPPYQPWEP